MSGRVSEHLIAAKIEQKCDIKRDPVFDHVYKLDFIVDRFKSIAKLIPIGVQVTTRMNDSMKLRKFYEQRKKKTMVDKSVYVEVHPDVDIDAWGAELVYNALVSFAFQKNTGLGDIVGVRVNANISYEFFDIVEALKACETSDTGPGKIVYYKPDKGYGFIARNNDQWFFHISAVSDIELKDEILPNLAVEQNGSVIDHVEVYFDDCGLDSPKNKYRRAENVARY